MDASIWFFPPNKRCAQVHCAISLMAEAPPPIAFTKQLAPACHAEAWIANEKVAGLADARRTTRGSSSRSVRWSRHHHAPNTLAGANHDRTLMTVRSCSEPNAMKQSIPPLYAQFRPPMTIA